MSDEKFDLESAMDEAWEDASRVRTESEIRKENPISRILIRNAARCLDCNEVIESKHRHDFRSCSCGNLKVDGGLDYSRRVYRQFDRYEELNEYRAETLEEYDARIREMVSWERPMEDRLRDAAEAITSLRGGVEGIRTPKESD